MILSCWNPSCTESPSYYCKCKNQKSFLCSAHIADHLDNDSSEHSLQIMFRVASQEKKEFIISQCKNIQESLNEIEAKILASFQAILSIINEQKILLINFFREQKESLQYIINKVNNEGKEIIVPGYEVIDNQSSYYISINKSLADQIAAESDEFIRKIQEYSNSIDNRKEFFSDILDYSGNANLDEHLYGFKNGTKTFIEFNTISLNIIKRDLKVESNHGSLACICQIPNKKLFYVGDYNLSTRCAYIIDLKTFEIELLTNVKYRAGTTATYYNNFVFLFGGIYGTTFVNNCEKYNLTSRKWFDIADFPILNKYYLSPLPCIDFFILSCFEGSDLYKYNILANNYETLTSEVSNSSMVVLFRNLKKYYYISGNSLFTSNESNLRRWVKSPKILSAPLTFNTSKPVTRGKYVYLLPPI